MEPQRSGEIIRPITPANNNGTVKIKGKKASKNPSSTSVEGKSPKKAVTPKNKEPTRTVSRGASTSSDPPQASKSISSDMKNGILKKSSEKVNKGNISKMVGTVQKRKEEIGVKHKKAISGEGNDPTLYNN